MTATEPVDLAAVRALADAATPGPWAYEREAGEEWYFGSGDQVVVRVGGNAPAWDRVAISVGGGEYEPDAVFIAAARTLVPALCDEVERLRAENERHRKANLVRAVVDGWTDRDEWITEVIANEAWDAVPWRVAQSIRDENEDLRRRLAESVPRSALVQVGWWCDGAFVSPGLHRPHWLGSDEMARCQGVYVLREGE